MQIINVTLVALLATSALACGDVDNGDRFEGEDGGELGTVEQPVLAFKTPNFGFGTQTGSSKLRCSLTSTGQVCSMPFSKAIDYHVDSSFTTTEASEIRADFATVQARVSGWAFTHKTNIQDAEWVVTKAAVSGSLSSNIDGYVDVTFGVTAALSDSLPGSYQTHETAVIKLDYTDANNRGANATEDQALRQHARFNGILKAMGAGAQTSLGAPGAADGCAALNCTFATRRSITPFQPNIVVASAGEKCQLQSYAPGTNPGQMLYSASVCASD